MKIYYVCRLSVCLIITLLVIISGCSSTQLSKFYLLQPMSDTETKSHLRTSKPGIIIGVGPVEFPDYLNRPQIVTRVGSNELRLSEFNRWAESLEENFSQVLAENLAKLLSTDSIFLYPWTGSAQIEYQVEVHVIRLDGVPSGEISLKVHWTLIDGDGNTILLMKRSNFIEPVSGQGYGELVAAKSRALASLSLEIAKDIRTISQKHSEAKTETKKGLYPALESNVLK